MREWVTSNCLSLRNKAGPGNGLYKCTELAARNELAMDNMAVHDVAEFDPESGLMQSADVGLNSLFALDGQALQQWQFACHPRIL